MTNFPHDITLSEVRSAIAEANARIGETSFIIKDCGDHFIANYIVSFSNTFEPLDGDPVEDRKRAVLRECRGLILDAATGEVIARRFNKFFNIGEREETLLHSIDFSEPHFAMRKMDGSMISAFQTSNGILRWGTKMGATEVADVAVQYIDQHPGYEKLVRDLIEQDKTALFEWCSRKQRIVIDYPEDQLVLLHVRDNRTGDYMSRAEIADLGSRYDIPVVEVVAANSVDDIPAFIETVRAWEDSEGVVIQFENTQKLFKLKADHYCLIHKTKDELSFEKNILALILEDKVDDVLPFLIEDDARAVTNYRDAVEHGLSQTASEINEIIAEARAKIGDDRKAFAEYHKGLDLDPMFGSQVFSVANGREPVSAMKRYMGKYLGSSSRVEMVRPLFRANWNDYRYAVIEE